jgi:hypothetical protein
MNIFFDRHFYNASKECFWPKKFSKFMLGFKSVILEKFKNCQIGTFEPMHEIRIFLAKSILLKHYENGN